VCALYGKSDLYKSGGTTDGVNVPFVPYWLFATAYTITYSTTELSLSQFPLHHTFSPTNLLLGMEWRRLYSEKTLLARRDVARTLSRSRQAYKCRRPFLLAAQPEWNADK